MSVRKDQEGLTVPLSCLVFPIHCPCSAHLSLVRMHGKTVLGMQFLCKIVSHAVTSIFHKFSYFFHIFSKKYYPLCKRINAEVWVWNNLVM